MCRAESCIVVLIVFVVGSAGSRDGATLIISQSSAELYLLVLSGPVLSDGERLLAVWLTSASSVRPDISQQMVLSLTPLHVFTTTQSIRLLLGVSHSITFVSSLQFTFT